MADELDEDELDKMLDDCLDDFDAPIEQPAETNAASSSNDTDPSPVQGPAEADQLPPEAEQLAAQLAAGMAELMKGLVEEGGEGSDFAQQMEETLQRLEKEEEQAPNPDGPQADDDVEANVNKTLQLLSESAQKLKGLEDNGDMEGMGQDMLQKLMQQLDGQADNGELDGVMETMMQQLLSKDIMLEPLEHIHEKYPAWIEEHRGSLSEDELGRYNKQQQLVAQIVDTYNNDPDNYQRVVELMQEMQECGQPPEEIIKELAPGLEFGEDGLPKLGASDEACCVM